MSVTRQIDNRIIDNAINALKRKQFHTHKVPVVRVRDVEQAYNIKIDFSVPGTWEGQTYKHKAWPVTFDTENDYLLFLLKWA